MTIHRRILTNATAFASIVSAVASAETTKTYCGTYHRLPSCGAESVIVDQFEVPGGKRLWLQARCNEDQKILCDLRASLQDLLIDGGRYCVEAEEISSPTSDLPAGSCRDLDVTLTRVWKDNSSETRRD